MDDVLWRPSAERIASATITAFTRAAEERAGRPFPRYEDLWRWSVDERSAFWNLVWEIGAVRAETKGDVVLREGDAMPGAKFFPNARLNFAENLLRRRDESDAIVFWAEDRIRRRLSYRELYEAVSRTAAALRALGIGPDDRVAAWLPNLPETVIVALATWSLGAVFSSSSPDFGVQGVLDRFGQIAPKVLFAADGYFYGGKRFDCLERLRSIVAGLPTLERLVVVPHTDPTPDLSDLRHAETFETFLAPHAAREIAFEYLPFDHPLAILYSSGTTGVPKCIVHGQGGTLLQHLKEHRLHCDIHPGDRVFYFTTCGWMMWNWLVSALASEATLLLYDGSPFAPSPTVLFDFAEREAATFFGASAKYIDALRVRHLTPRETHDLSRVRTIASTGSPLVPESFDYVYSHVAPHACLSSISGGTDIVSCFVLGNPTLPVHRGEIQCKGLGMRVEVFDEEGHPAENAKGELVCTAPFPSMPIGFLNDPDGSRYHAAYFERFPGVWTHGDWVEATERGGMIIYGRSDATLNPGGVRIGTAEIYRQVEQLDEVVESIAVGQPWQGDVRIVLFVKLREACTLDDALIAKIKKRIRDNTTPRHVPAKILAIDDIPRTKSGKITELAVRDMIAGRPVKNREALANPEALEAFRDLEALRD